MRQWRRVPRLQRASTSKRDGCWTRQGKELESEAIPCIKQGRLRNCPVTNTREIQVDTDRWGQKELEERRCQNGMRTDLRRLGNRQTNGRKEKRLSASKAILGGLRESAWRRRERAAPHATAGHGGLPQKRRSAIYPHDKGKRRGVFLECLYLLGRE